MPNSIILKPCLHTQKILMNIGSFSHRFTKILCYVVRMINSCQKVKSLTTRKHSSRMRTARFMVLRGRVSGGWVYPTSPGPYPRPPKNMGTEIPYPQKGHGTRDQRYSSPQDRMTHTCENITFPQLRGRTANSISLTGLQRSFARITLRKISNAIIDFFWNFPTCKVITLNFLV